jgi:hypothetical protein
MTHVQGRWAVGLVAALAACGDSGGGDGTTTGMTGGLTLVSAGSTGTSGAPTEAMTTASEGSGSAEGGSSSSGDVPTTDALTGTVTGSTTMVGPAVCGDGIVSGDEGCDDGANNGPGQSCHADCTPNVCGDGDKGPAEACDEGDMNGPDAGCSARCSINASSCGDQSFQSELTPLPVDIIIVIDNSGSMGEEILGVQSNINVNFAQIFEASGIDYRVILVARHGQLGEENVCIEAPLSGIAAGGCVDPPPQPVFNDGKFYHYSVSVSSHDALCKLLNTYDGTLPDDFGLGAGGWKQWLRPEATKSFIALTDDGVDCSYKGNSFDDNDNVNSGVTTGDKFDQTLLALAPDQFGADPATRNYHFYTIAGLPFNDPQELPYPAKDPIVLGKCPTAVAPGTGYQQISKLSDALRFPLCDTTSYDVVFQEIASGVINSAELQCEFAIPEAPEGKTLDTESILVEFTPNGMGMPVSFMQVAGPDACTPTSFYIEGDQIQLCPAACDSIQGDAAATIEVKFTCEPIEAG